MITTGRTTLRDRENVHRPPAVTSLLQLSERSWQVRWSEEHRGLDGTLLGKSTWEAVLAVETVPPTAADAIQANPFGLFVTEIRWTKQL